jgi:hypothetical protein
MGASSPEAAMKKAQVIALWVIAALLLGNFSLNHVKPFAVLSLNAQTYMNAARRCHEAAANRRQVQDNIENYDETMRRALNQSASVAMMDCFAKRRLGEYLLASGVTRHDLNEIELDALNATGADVSYFTQNLMEMK